MMYTNRNEHEQKVIAKAYDFEIKAIEHIKMSDEIVDDGRNPWFDEIMSWADGHEVWEAINTAVEMAV